jgi:hypothetical protein
MLIVDSKNSIICPYCGPKNLKPNLTCTLFRDINNGDFFLVRLHDLLLVLVWLGKTHNDVVKDDPNEFFKMLKMQWWIPVKRHQV